MPFKAGRGARVYAEPCELNYRETEKFFQDRTALYDPRTLSVTMYQTEQLASMRDSAEKNILVPLLHVGAQDEVLDIGCGNGRWAQTLAGTVRRYTGLDFNADLITAARVALPEANFHVMPAQQFRRDCFPEALFSLVIVSGILAYLNDSDVAALFREIAAATAAAARIYVREPMARHVRLTLDRFWSDELQAHYSAVYRTRAEYFALFDGTLGPAGFRLSNDGQPLPEHLQNRKETEQRFMIFSRPQ